MSQCSAGSGSSVGVVFQSSYPGMYSTLHHLLKHHLPVLILGQKLVHHRQVALMRIATVAHLPGIKIGSADVASVVMHHPRSFPHPA